MKLTPYAKLLRFCREERKLSQVDVAGRLKLSRASYLSLEKGIRELTLAEALCITELYGLTIDEITKGTVPDYAKYKEMIRSLLRLAAGDKLIIKKTKLAKLLYLVDFSWYYINKTSMSQLPYRKYPFGPTADAYFRMIDEMEIGGEISITQVARDDYHMYEIKETRTAARLTLTKINTKEAAHIKKVWQAWKDASTAEILAFTTAHIPYRDTHDGDIIAYDLIKSESPHTVF